MRTNGVLIALAFSLFSLAAGASPADSRLLPMVPADAQVVSGMKVTLAAEARAQLSLVVHDNNVDFKDWLALVGVDPGLSGQELVEAAASSPRGELAERLLLVDGSFDAAHIYRAALEGGASTAEFAGVRVVIVLPFAREKNEQVGGRWLAIPDHQTALFGTPLLVQKALNRRASHARVHSALAAHLKELRGGVEDWSIVTIPPDVFKRHLGDACYAAKAIQALTRPDDLVMGFRYGRSKTTIDFVARAHGDVPEAVTSPNGWAQWLTAKFNRDPRVRLEQVVAEGRRVSGTLTVTDTKGNDSTRELANR